MLNKILNSLKKIRFSNLIYPAILIMVIALTILVFSLSVKFITLNVSRALEIDEKTVESELIKIDMPTYLLVAKKLGVAIEEPSKPVPPTETAPPPPVTENKKDLKIAVLNSTITPGLAAALKKDLTDSDFTIGTTGNSSPTLQKTVIKIKAGKSVSYPSSIDEMKSIVGKKYVLEEEVLEEGETDDIVVIIGSQ